MKSVTLPIPRHIKQLIVSIHGSEPIEILKITTVNEYRRLKFKAEKTGFDLLEERIDKCTIDLLIPKAMTDLFENPEYWYQAWYFFHKYFEEQLINHIRIQTRYPDVILVGSIVDFMQMHGISTKDISIDTCRKKWERYVKKSRSNEQLTMKNKPLHHGLRSI